MDNPQTIGCIVAAGADFCSGRAPECFWEFEVLKCVKLALDNPFSISVHLFFALVCPAHLDIK